MHVTQSETLSWMVFSDGIVLKRTYVLEKVITLYCIIACATALALSYIGYNGNTDSPLTESCLYLCVSSIIFTPKPSKHRIDDVRVVTFLYDYD